MDRLSSLLEFFKPKAHQVELLRSNQQQMSLPQGSSIAVMHRGRARISVDRQPDVSVQAGDLLWLNLPSHRQLHSDGDDFQLLCCRLDFGPVSLNPLFDQLPSLIKIDHDDPSRHGLNPVIELLLQESLEPHCGQETVINRLAEVLLVYVLRYIMRTQKVEVGVLAGLSDLRIARAMVAMHAQPERRWSVESLAAEAGMSRTAFNQHFRDTVGCPPGEYLSQWRMRLACRLLETSKLGVSQIVDQLGYQSETAFFRAFRRQMGVSPGKYRSRMLFAG